MEQNAEINQEIVRSRPVLEMITVANDFTGFIGKAEEYQRDQILIYLQRVLPLIYIKASLLPSIRVTDEEAIEHFVTEEQWENVFNAIRAILGTDDEFYFIDLQEHSHHDAVRASIAEGVADLYQDLKDFILLYQKPIYTFQENAVNECRDLFYSRYGYQLVRIHTAIHHLICEKEGEDPNQASANY